MTRPYEPSWAPTTRAFEALDAEIKMLRDALIQTRAIVSDGAMVGFAPLDGDWADRLFANNGTITRVLTETEATS